MQNTSGIFTVKSDGSELMRWHTTGHSPDWSPNGLELTFAEEDAQTGTYGIFRLILADTSLIPLTISGTDPQYNPAGTRIAYRDPQGVSYYRLKVINTDGSNGLTLADSCATFDWSPDGDYLIFDHYVPGVGMRISRVPANNLSGKMTLVNGGATPSITSLGWIAYQGLNADLSLGIFIMDLGGDNQQHVSTEGYQPNYMPGGATVVYAGNSGLWTVNP
jgi:hypothetical protein